MCKCLQATDSLVCHQRILEKRALYFSYHLVLTALKTYVFLLYFACFVPSLRYLITEKSSDQFYHELHSLQGVHTQTLAHTLKSRRSPIMRIEFEEHAKFLESFPFAFKSLPIFDRLRL